MEKIGIDFFKSVGLEKGVGSKFKFLNLIAKLLLARID